MQDDGQPGPPGPENMRVSELVPSVLVVKNYAWCESVTTGVAKEICNGGTPGERPIFIVSWLAIPILLRLGNSEVQRLLGFTFRTTRLTAGPGLSLWTSLVLQLCVVVLSNVLPVVLVVV